MTVKKGETEVLDGSPGVIKISKYRRIPAGEGISNAALNHSTGDMEMLRIM